jgi:hypothetical protein
MTIMRDRLTGKAHLAIVLGVLSLGLAFATTALAASEGPRWKLTATSLPRNLAPGGTGQIAILATNVGNGVVNAPGSPVTVTLRLPPGVIAKSILHEPEAGYLGRGLKNLVKCEILSASGVKCVYAGEEGLPPYETIEIRVAIEVGLGARSGGEVEVNASGGEAPNATLHRPLAINGEPTPFGVEEYELFPENADGTPDTQAGSHPYQLTTTLTLNQVEEENPNRGKLPSVPALARNLRFNLPPGLIGNPTVVPQCSEIAFDTVGYAGVNHCPPDTAVGVAIVTANEPEFKAEFTIPVPVFNLKPSVGEPLRMGWDILGVPTILDTSVRTGGDYGAVVSVSNIPQSVSFLSDRVSFWGVPGDPRHDQSRGWQCIGGGYWRFSTEEPCSALGKPQAPPFLTLPTSCTGPLETSVEATSWPSPLEPVGITVPAVKPGSMIALDGCNHLGFSPEIKVTPDSEAGSSPSGLAVNIHVPQDESLVPTGLSESNVKDTTVALPEGVVLNPAAADGLMSCSLEEVSLESAISPSCPEASKVGTVTIHSPLLPDPLEGEVYLAAQGANPFGSLVAMYIAAEDPKSGVLIKVAGEVHLTETGQIVSTFKNTPQLPFEDLQLHFFGGDRAPLATPAICGSYTTTASIAPWSGNEPATPAGTFHISSGPNGAPCMDPLPFNPSLTAGTTSIQAGGFSPFTMTMSRPNGNQNLRSIKLRMPPGLLGTLATVKLCKEEQANAGTCGPDSLIGHTTVSVGVGGDPYSVTGGEVFITEGYGGAPYGLSIVNPAKAGPFDLGKVVVRAKIEVDPITAALTITSDDTGPYKIPTILDGIPLQIQHVNVSIDRSGFTFNPTDCSPLAITGGLTSDQGATKDLSVPFQITNCAVLAFKPKLTAKTAGKTSRANGASLLVKLTYPAGPYDANIARVKVDLPKQLPSRLTTLQKACTAATFEANPANCPAASIVGHATATTPVMPVPLTGPAYFVSHGGEAFPSLIIVLQGYGATVHLIGTTFIDKAGITSSTFKQVPDVPVGTFELTLPQGKYSALAANGNLCTAKKLAMPTSFVAQNGAVIHTSTPIVPTGCAKHKAAKKAPKRGQAKHKGHRKK